MENPIDLQFSMRYLLNRRITLVKLNQIMQLKKDEVPNRELSYLHLSTDAVVV